MDSYECRACRGRGGDVVVDLGEQPACDYFPNQDEPGPDPVYPLQMWLCASCGLAQLLTDPTVAEEPKGAEPAALVAQARDAVARVAAAGLLPVGARVAEYGSPHGGSWLDLLAARGLKPVTGGDEADVIIDCFGMMHAADQAAAITERAAQLAPGGTLLLQYHSLAAIVRQGQWNALRHGHYAYYSATALTAMLASAGLRPCAAWQFSLYGGTVLLAAGHDNDDRATVVTGGGGDPGETVRSLLADEAHGGITSPSVVGGLQREVAAQGDALRAWLTAQRAAGRSVLGYSAASRAVALLCSAGVDADLLPAVADASPGKRGLRMPGTAIPVISPAELTAAPPDAVLVFVPDLIPEVSEAYPEIEAAGAVWVDIGSLSGSF
jgi:C-methyltransferase C-terminal domain/Putative zinc binding domain/Methyltransferase domain